MTRDKIVRISYWTDAVAAQTDWTFIGLETSSGLTGVGEATLTGQHASVARACRELANLVFSLPSAASNALPADYPLHTLATAAVYCGIDQALWDLEGQRVGRPVAQLLAGGRTVETFIPLYANINRRTQVRSAGAFAASALEAVAAGFATVKIAPFDEVTPAVLGTAELVRALDLGLARVAAVRAAIGAERDLFVDCHWRFDARTASAVVGELAAYNVSWMECPVPEVSSNLAVLTRLRSEANARGMRLAGAEFCTRREAFRPFLDCGAYDVMMPDAKYAGGLAEMVALAEEFERAGVAFSPHNPSGPVCHAASLHVCAVAPALDCLEVQFDETPEFGLLQQMRLPPFDQARAPMPSAPGLGVSLDRERVAALARDSWTCERSG